MLRWLVGSRLWVAFAAACWSVESFVRCDTWVRWTLVAQIFFLTWIAYLFLTDDAIRKYRIEVLVALTGACVTFQGVESLLWTILCALSVFLYRTHWMPSSWKLAKLELRNVPILNNLLIASCWVTMCMLWPFYQAGAAIQSQGPFIASAFCWVLALSMAEDLFVENMPDATLRRLGQSGMRMLTIILVLCSLAISFYFGEMQRSVWISMCASLILLLYLREGKRTPAKSFLLDAMMVLRFPF